MRLVRRVVAWLLLGLWLPATLHCGLEAAVILDPETNGSSHGCCQTADVERKDECNRIESGEYRSEQQLMTVPAPTCTALAAWAEGLARAEACGNATVQAVVAYALTDRDWVPEWHFVRRDAPSPRAPDSSVV